MISYLKNLAILITIIPSASSVFQDTFFINNFTSFAFVSTSLCQWFVSFTQLVHLLVRSFLAVYSFLVPLDGTTIINSCEIKFDASFVLRSCVVVYSCCIFISYATNINTLCTYIIFAFNIILINALTNHLFHFGCKFLVFTVDEFWRCFNKHLNLFLLRLLVDMLVSFSITSSL